MKRQKLLKVAGGALAAAMSLAMLAGCSGNTTSGSSSTGETGTASESSTAGETTGTEKEQAGVLPSHDGRPDAVRRVPFPRR